MEAQKTSIEAWMTYADGKKDEGIILMQKAADLEDATVKNPVSPGELLPARELLGDMFMQMNKPAEALAAYEQSLVSRPTLFNSLYGAGYAAEKSGDSKNATLYYSHLLTVVGTTASSREQLDHARKAMSPG